MKISGIIWLRDIVDKLSWKHNVATEEVEEVFAASPRYRYIKKGNVDGEDLYAALGQIDSGQYLIVFFVYKTTAEALIVSARDMTPSERRIYARK
jgi:hypothetical protein